MNYENTLGLHQQTNSSLLYGRREVVSLLHVQREETMTEREKLLITIIYLMRQEIDCLRSVLSEFEGDKNHFVQMNIANDLEVTIDKLETKV